MKLKAGKKYKCICCWTRKLAVYMAADYICTECLKGKLMGMFTKE